MWPMLSHHYQRIKQQSFTQTIHDNYSHSFPTSNNIWNKMTQIFYCWCKGRKCQLFASEQHRSQLETWMRHSAGKNRMMLMQDAERKGTEMQTSITNNWKPLQQQYQWQHQRQDNGRVIRNNPDKPLSVAEVNIRPSDSYLPSISHMANGEGSNQAYIAGSPQIMLLQKEMKLLRSWKLFMFLSWVLVDNLLEGEGYDTIEESDQSFIENQRGKLF